jgi:hypothetical protein
VSILTDWLLLLVVPFTAWAAWIKWKTDRRSAFVARVYMLIVFSIAGLASLGVINLDPATRIVLLRCGWFALVFDECITWIKYTRWSRKVQKENGRSP